MSDHDWRPHWEVCRKCGLELAEWMEFLPRSCTGNAYICRVMRRMLEGMEPFRIMTVPMNCGVCRGRWYAKGPYETLRPWAIDAGRFAWTLTVYLMNGPRSEMIGNLLFRVAEDPTVCPVLADALEEAGCEDLNLLSALRS